MHKDDFSFQRIQHSEIRVIDERFTDLYLQKRTIFLTVSMCHYAILFMNNCFIIVTGLT